MGCYFSELEDDSMVLEFLVILKKSDFSKTFECLNKKNQILRTLSKLPGNVRIGKFGETGYTIKGLKMPYVLYTKLPKENIYVTSDSWDTEYFHSQILELIQIFTALGAYEIKFDTDLEHNSEKTLKLATGLKIPNIPIKLSAEITHAQEEDSDISFDGLIKIKSITQIEYSGIDDFINKNKLYYTKFYPDWKNIIEYKLNNTIIKLEFEHTFKRGFYCSTTLGADIEKNGISCDISGHTGETTSVSFKVSFQDPRSKSHGEIYDCT